MKKLIRWIRDYKLFWIAAIALIISLILQITNHKTIAHWVISVVSIAEVLPLAWSMIDDLRTGKYGIDVLAATAIITSVILKQYWAAIIVVLMLTGGESLENYAEKKAHSELDALLKRAPQKATVFRKGKPVVIKVDEIKVGDKILIKAGQIVPVDAQIIEGSSNFDESSITGESLPELRAVGAAVLSGSINIDGPVTAKATAISSDSQYQQIITLVKNAGGNQAPFVRLADRYSVPFTLISYALASAVWIISGHAIRFLEVIIVATPCPLLLAAPIALISGMARASRYGIIIKTGSALEKFSEARTVAIDKTGTLTKGDIAVSRIKLLTPHTESEILKIAATLESNSNHVLAEAMVKYAADKGIRPIKAKHIEEVAGLGVKGNIKGADILIGNQKLMEENNIHIPNALRDLKANETIAYVSSNRKIMGSIYFSDTLRPEAKETLAYLHASGVKDIVMITGDHQTAANIIAEELGIDKVYADCLPADKLHTLSKFKKRPVVFIGDGVNDAPVLTSADVGIALGAKGSTAASESADMVIMLDDLSRVATAMQIAKKTFKIAEQSIFIGIGLSFVLMALFATGKIQPVYGAILQEVVDVFVIFNALRAHAIKPLVMEQK